MAEGCNNRTGIKLKNVKISEYDSEINSDCLAVTDIVAKLVSITWGILDVSDNLRPFVYERIEQCKLNGSLHCSCCAFILNLNAIISFQHWGVNV